MLKIRPVLGTKPDDEYVGLHGYWVEQWSQFIHNCNWYDFDVIKLAFEDDRVMGGFEIDFVVLGLGFHLRWNYAKTEKVEEIERRAIEARKEFDRRTIERRVIEARKEFDRRTIDPE